MGQWINYIMDPGSSVTATNLDQKLYDALKIGDFKTLDLTMGYLKSLDLTLGGDTDTETIYQRVPLIHLTVPFAHHMIVRAVHYDPETSDQMIRFLTKHSRRLRLFEEAPSFADTLWIVDRNDRGPYEWIEPKHCTQGQNQNLSQGQNPLIIMPIDPGNVKPLEFAIYVYHAIQSWQGRETIQRIIRFIESLDSSSIKIH